jgi:hypothetical protein
MIHEFILVPGREPAAAALRVLAAAGQDPIGTKGRTQSWRTFPAGAAALPAAIITAVRAIGHLAYRGDLNPLGPLQPGLRILAPQHGGLLAQHQRLGILRRRRTCEQRHLVSQADEHQVKHPYRHEPAIMPAHRPSRQAYSQVSHLCPRFGTNRSGERAVQDSPHVRPGW